MPKHRRTLALALVAALFAACAPHRPPPHAPPTAFPPDFPAAAYAALAPEQTYRVEPARSSLRLEVYRTGALAALGHNHVIDSRGIDGFIYLADDLVNARADLFVPVEGFVIDDPAARAAAGPDFATQPTPSDIEGTRANLLGPKLLDAQAWPFILIHVEPLHVGAESTRVQLTIQVRDHMAVMPVDARWSRRGDELAIEANFEVDHATLGLEPFSALGGALRVAERMRVAVSLAAKVRSAGTVPGS